MRFLTLLLLTSCFSLLPARPLRVVSYNCENAFDPVHAEGKQDAEFTPDGSHHWTYGRLKRKTADLARTIIAAGGEGATWRLPDIAALMEIENDSVINWLLHRSPLQGAGMRHLITNGPDVRGINTAIIYNPFTVRVLARRDIRVPNRKDERPTRDILYAAMLLQGGDTLHLFAVHAPSRYGGAAASEPYRLRYTQAIAQAIDSIRHTTAEPYIMVCGDFNDYTYNRSIRQLTDPQGHSSLLTHHSSLIDVSEHACGLYNGQDVPGTYRFQGRWESLDHILVSRNLKAAVADCHIFDAPWLLEPASGGQQQVRRTYRGPSYHGGVSDHLPLVVQLEIDN